MLDTGGREILQYGYVPVPPVARVDVLLLSAGAAWCVEPPGWWANPSPGTAELVYEKGSSEGAATETEARQEAFAAALAMLRARIAGDPARTGSRHLTGADIAFEHSERGRDGRWSAWVLASYPAAQLEKDRARTAESAAARTPILVLPFSFGRESEEQFPEVVKAYKSLGYGNAIWQTVEDLLYDHRFEIVTAPQSRTRDLLRDILGAEADAAPTERPKLVLLCNMNFFESHSETLSWGRVLRRKEYHVELLLELHEPGGPRGAVKIPAKGEAKDQDLLTATRAAARMAVDKLVARLEAR